MAKHRTSFVIGTLLGGAAATAAAVWNSPQSGEKTRRQVIDRIESTIFDLLGTSESKLARRLTPERPAPIVASIATPGDAVQG